MNVIAKAVDDIKRKVPKQILSKVFIPYDPYGRTFQSFSLDEQIIENVIKARVLVDCNIIGGTEVLVSLEGLPVDNVNVNMLAVHIPKERTQGRSITSALSVVFVNAAASSSVYGANTGMSANGCSSTLLSAANGLLKSFDSIPTTSTARIQLIAENTILVKEMSMLPGNCYLRCMLSNDEELSNIPMRAYMYFSKLVELAVKSYIYNELIIGIDMGQLEGGAMIGVFKDIVQGYSDAEELYQDYLINTMQGVLFTSDMEAWHRHVKLIVGGNR